MISNLFSTVSRWAAAAWQFIFNFDFFIFFLISANLVFIVSLAIYNREYAAQQQQINAENEAAIRREENLCALSCLPYVSKRIEISGEMKCYCYNNAGTFEPNE